MSAYSGISFHSSSLVPDNTILSLRYDYLTGIGVRNPKAQAAVIGVTSDLVVGPLTYFKLVYGKPPFWADYCQGTLEMERMRRKREKHQRRWTSR